MFRVYVSDRGGVYWLRKWIFVDGGVMHPVLSTKRDHAMTYKRFDDALADSKRLQETGNEAHIDAMES